MKLRPRHSSCLIAALFACSASLALAADEPGITSSPLEEPPKEDSDPQYEAVVLRGLNKVTAKTSTLETPVGTTVRFGTLDISVHRCWRSDPDAQPENAALLEVLELKPGEAPEQIFLGWMFASSPGLSSIEHPVYDITVISCETMKEESTPSDAPPPPPPAQH
ncbi:MAG: DUF2155 domain-containing protein [Alphaproteobacteria bacterium]